MKNEKYFEEMKARIAQSFERAILSTAIIPVTIFLLCQPLFDTIEIRTGDASPTHKKNVVMLPRNRVATGQAFKLSKQLKCPEGQNRNLVIGIMTNS